MGRKPNPLILEYFNRGAKLDDASNRYHHTCKQCGEEFPKGRIDSLVAHLTKKCTAISLPERTKIVLRLHDLGDGESGPKNSTNSRLSKGTPVDLPYSPSRPQNFIGLNVLAEASRRVGVTERTRVTDDTNDADRRSQAVDPALEIEGEAFPAGFLNVPDETLNIRPNGSSASGAVPQLPAIFSYLPQQQGGGQDDSNSLPGLETSLPSHLSSIAASANDIMPIEPDVDMSNDHISVALFNHLGSFNEMPHSQSGLQTRSSVTWPPHAYQKETVQDILPTSDAGSPQNTGSRATEYRTNNGPRPIAMHPDLRPTHFVSETGTAAKSQRPKVRSRFAAERRKEVQQVRKQGACIRCRMLKKPCSGETPCTTCKSVESARLWKHPCIRTRIADEFTLFAAGLQSTLVFHDILNIKAQISFETFSGRIEMFHFKEKAPVVTFSALTGQKALQPLGLGLAFLKSDNQVPSPPEVLILDPEGDDVNTKMEHYVRAIAPTLFAKEASTFLRATLLFASDLGQENEDTLLSRVLELWSAASLLTDLDLTWNIRTNLIQASEPPNTSLMHPLAVPVSLEGQKPINDTTSPYSYALICSQLRSAIERRINNLSKYIMNEIERRLLQRQSGGRFHTFLASIIFLNCVERFCWLFLTWQESENNHARWPLDKSPQAYADEGERFADILDMLSKMRSLAPKCNARRDSGIFMPVEDEDGLATRWFTEVNVNQTFLDHSAAVRFDQNNSRSMDGKYFARVLQPQACYT